MAVPLEPVDTTTWELFHGFFPVRAGFVQEILSNVFPASDFETKSATTGVGFILPCSVSGSPGNGYIYYIRERS
jgi:hypothetical protein